jgi:hypothetical protein
MIRLIVDRCVLDVLRIAVPKKNKAKERLEKYVQNLEREVNAHIFQNRDVLMVAKQHYRASLTAIQEEGGQIWSLKNIRTHKWLEGNGLQLVEQVNTGQANNITGEISIIKFTDLVQVQDDDDLKVLQGMTDAQLDNHLKSLPANEICVYQNLLADFKGLPNPVIASDYDLLCVDTASTIRYIKNLIRGRVRNKDRTEYRKALRILRIAQINNNVFPQKKRKSEFGRTYYEGVSIQSVNKDLRKAILSGCYEYDVKSSVIAWKFGFAQELLNSEGSVSTVEDEFLAIWYYLTFKKDFFESLQAEVFDNECDLSDKEQVKKIKSAITALSFGAKLVDITWKNEHGKDTSSSLAGIFPNDLLEERKRFLKANEVVQFQKQQARLDKFIISKFIAQCPYLLSMTSLQTKTGRRANSKILAWLYQQAETIVMDIVRDELKKLRVPVKANIHDAIVVGRQLSANEIQRIEGKVKSITNLSFFGLGETHYQA